MTLIKMVEMYMWKNREHLMCLDLLFTAIAGKKMGQLASQHQT
jgi:hypothetical protein